MDRAAQEKHVSFFIRRRAFIKPHRFDRRDNFLAITYNGVDA